MKLKQENEPRNSSVELELQSILKLMRSALGDSEMDSIIQSVASPDEQGLLRPGARVGVTKKKPPGDQLTSPSKTKASVTKDTKVLLEETKKVWYCICLFRARH